MSTPPRPAWAANTPVVHLSPAVTLSDPFATAPIPPPPTPSHIVNATAGNVVFLGAMYGVEDGHQSSVSNTAVRLYAQRDASTGHVWVLAYYTQTTQRSQAHQALISSGIADHFPPLPPASVAWCVWDTLDNFLNTTYAALQQRHFRTIPNPAYGQLPDQHRFFTGVWRTSQHPAHADKMRSYGVLAWSLNAAVVQLGVVGLPTLDGAERQQWLQHTAVRERG